MIHFDGSVIAAISTAMSNSGIGIVRMCGVGAFEIADFIYRGKNSKKLCDQKTHTIHYGHIYDGEEMIDEVLVMLMRGPHSYTGEDTVEINCHGGVYVVKRVLETLIKYGARPAEPGEFTKRAFLNGKIDLSQAEAVGDIISSKNEYALQSSVHQLKGNVKEKINRIRNKIIYHTAFIESALDDPEHITLEGYGEALAGKLDSMLLDMNLLISNAENGRMLSEGIKTVILGKPNAGKSSLLNLLLGEERAIVTEIAGTTRDTLEEQILLDGIGLKLIDTAGIRETEDVVEKIGVTKAVGQAEDADLILYVVDSSVNLDDSDRQIIEMIKERRGIVLMNKSDLEGVLDSRLLCKLTDKRVIPFSAKEGFGLSELKDAIKDMFMNQELSFNDEWCLTNLRHKQAMGEAFESLKLVKQSVEDGMPEDFFSIDLMNAYEKLGLIVGEAVEDDLVEEIFSHFCMGK